MNGGYTDPESMSYDPALPQQPGIPFSALIRGITPVPQVLFPPLAQLAMGCSNPLLFANVRNLRVREPAKIS